MTYHDEYPRFVKSVKLQTKCDFIKIIIIIILMMMMMMTTM
jgi:hypothetical protein